MPTTIEHIKGSELPEKVVRQLHVSPEQLYTITIDVMKEEEKKRPHRLMDLFDVGPGAFDNPDEIDDFVRKERDSWD
jgi:hypothetical protein